MPQDLCRSKWLALFVIILHLPLTVVGQTAESTQPFGFDQPPICGSCGPWQASSIMPDWDDTGFQPGDSDLFVSQCGCDHGLPVSCGDPCMQTSYPDEYYAQSHEGRDSCMMPDRCGVQALFPVQSCPRRCNSCGPRGCGGQSGCRYPSGCSCQLYSPCGNVAPFWFRAEALIWRSSGVNLPDLVTTSDPGTQQSDAGVLGLPTTQTLYGGNTALGESRGGFRLRGGTYFDSCGTSGMDLEFFMLGTRHSNYHGESTGDPILARPFLNAATDLNDAQLVAFPDLASGTIDMQAKSNLYSGAMHYRRIFWKVCDSDNGCSRNCPRRVPRSFTMGFQIGPRVVSLRESFSSDVLLTSSDTQGQSRNYYDSFSAKNQFLGYDLGLFGSRQRRRWSIDGAVRLGIGGTKQELDVYGQTTATQAGTTTTTPGGFLAQRTNSGSFDRREFTLIPQFDIALGYQMTDTWSATVGYSLLYWSHVLRATDQIDPALNPGLLPPVQNPMTGDPRPEVRMHQTDYLAQGITIGLEKRW